MDPFFRFPRRFRRILDRLDEPRKIQDFIDFELGYSYSNFTHSPLEVLKRRKAHCLDGAILAAASLYFHGQRPLLMDLSATRDEDHVVALHRRGRYWGGIAQSKFTGLRFREAVYPSVAELARSYFEQYYNLAGEKTLRAYSAPLDLSKRAPADWLSTTDDLSSISDLLQAQPHFDVLGGMDHKKLRRVDSLDWKAHVLGEPTPILGQRRAPIGRLRHLHRARNKPQS